MTRPSPNLKLLARSEDAAIRTVVPMPPRRWRSRVLLPGLILVSAVSLVAFTARTAFEPAVDVWVSPVIAKPASAAEAELPRNETPSVGRTFIAQAPGWIEADPFPITIPALAEGVIKDMLIVEGQPINAGQIVARMIDEDARLAADSAAAELAFEEAELQRARFNLEYQQVVYERLLRLHENANAPDIEWAGAKRDRDDAEAQVRSSEAKVARHRVVCEQAKLALSRMEICSPVAGVVMERLVEPGTRISMGNVGAGERMGAVARLYDPAKLQVRVDVPLADAAKVGIGTPAEISTEAMPDVVFHGVVSRLVHEADIQRNTVQVKVAITDPAETLKPEMLTRARFYEGAARKTGESGGAGRSTGGMHLLAPAAGLRKTSNEEGDLWIVDHLASGTVASSRRVSIIGVEQDGYVPILGDIQYGIRVIIDPPAGLRAGARVRVKGEKSVETGR